MCSDAPLPRSELKYSVPSAVNEGSAFHVLRGRLIGGGRGRGSPHPKSFRSTSQIRIAPRVPSGNGRDEANTIRFPVGSNLGAWSRYFPENGRASGALHRPARKRETHISARRGAVVYGTNLEK